LNELIVPECHARKDLTEEQHELFKDALAQLASDTSQEGFNTSRPATASGMNWDQGRYVAEDGAVILSTLAGIIVQEVQGVKDLDVITMAACGTGLRGIRSLRKNRHEVQAPAAA